MERTAQHPFAQLGKLLDVDDPKDLRFERLPARPEYTNVLRPGATRGPRVGAARPGIRWLSQRGVRLLD